MLTDKYNTGFASFYITFSEGMLNRLAKLHNSTRVLEKRFNMRFQSRAR